MILSLSYIVIVITPQTINRAQTLKSELINRQGHKCHLIKDIYKLFSQLHVAAKETTCMQHYYKSMKHRHRHGQHEYGYIDIYNVQNIKHNTDVGVG